MGGDLGRRHSTYLECPERSIIAAAEIFVPPNGSYTGDKGRDSDMGDTAALISLATSVPPYQFHQKQILAAARDVLTDRYPEFEQLSSLFANTGISHRYGVKPIEWYLEQRGWPERTQAFLEGAEKLFIDVAGKAIAGAGLSAGDIDTVVTVSSTGIATPTLEARVAGKLGFRQDVSRVPVFGLGCAGGVSGLSIAARLAQARPGTNVLLVALELCTLAVRHDELTKANVVAASLFGDGAAAVVLRAGDGGATRIEASGEKLWPDTLDIMGWTVDPEGFGVIFKRTIPGFVAEHMRPAVAEMLSRTELSIDDIDRFICHPGGTKVIRALEQAFALHQGALDHEREVIADYGNMSSPTVLFVLERARAQGLPPRSLLTALGPGFTASCVALRHAA
jgi:alkylresorcinol/alkylpyrone synthase